MAGDFGHYEVLGEIGRGGMGIVYRARDKRDDRVLAIKQLVFTNIDPTKEHEFRDRFRREAATAARLKHPNIVTVHEVCMDNPKNYFYVMELLDGLSLRHELERKGGRLTAKAWSPIFEQVVEALSFAHSMNVVHRDVKPDNIFLLKDGTVKITDFGIARAAEYEETQLTKTGVMMGTLAYVSPEQLQDAKRGPSR
jgi:eukaryotic-like serine/threonine-protein kinase